MKTHEKPVVKSKQEKEKKAEDPEIIEFRAPDKFERWLRDHHSSSTGIWLRIYKKGSGVKSVVYKEALDEALCYGWIDGQKKSFDEHSFLQRFTPRRTKSIWSKRNQEHVARLIESGKMRSTGLKQVDAAKEDGRWDQAYDSPANMTVPADFLKELAKNKDAVKYFGSLNKTNKYAITWRLQTAKKPETRERRMKAILEMLAAGKKFHG
jgi:uncharacterized protein YdeI (YjbR/CyaY-like superfamily)